MEGSVRVRRGDPRNEYIRQHPLALTVAAVCALTALAFLVIEAPKEAAITVALTAPVATLWMLMLGAGGALTLWGAWHQSPRIEAGGLVLLAAACTADIYAIVAVRGPGSLLGSSPILGVGLGAAIRAVLIVQAPGSGRDSWRG